MTTTETPLSEAEIAETRAICNAATPSPWHASVVDPTVILNKRRSWIAQALSGNGQQQSAADAAFIVHARMALPRALATAKMWERASAADASTLVAAQERIEELEEAATADSVPVSAVQGVIDRLHEYVAEYRRQDDGRVRFSQSDLSTEILKAAALLSALLPSAPAREGGE